MWKIQVGKDKGSYVTRYSLPGEAQAVRYFNSLNTHSGYKKRLLDPNGKVVARVLT